jgi:hypothetical protein
MLYSESVEWVILAGQRRCEAYVNCDAESRAICRPVLSFRGLFKQGNVMAISWEHESEHLLVARITGKLATDDIAGFQQAVAPLVKASGQISFLVVLDDFAGWKAGKGWEDTSFADENDEYLSRFAIVGDEEWRDKVLMFSLAGLRPVEIEFFTAEAAARDWLGAA